VEQKKGAAFYIPAEGGIIRSTLQHGFEQLLNNTDRSQAVAILILPRSSVCKIYLSIYSF